jgi:hypothetical protein
MLRALVRRVQALNHSSAAHHRFVVAKPKLKNQLVILLWSELASKATLDLQTSSSVFGTNPALVLFTILDANFDKKRQDTAKCNEINGAGGGNRTHGLGIMRPSLYH